MLGCPFASHFRIATSPRATKPSTPPAIRRCAAASSWDSSYCAHLTTSRLRHRRVGDCAGHGHLLSSSATKVAWITLAASSAAWPAMSATMGRSLKPTKPAWTFCAAWCSSHPRWGSGPDSGSGAWVVLLKSDLATHHTISEGPKTRLVDVIRGGGLQPGCAKASARQKTPAAFGPHAPPLPHVDPRGYGKGHRTMPHRHGF